jgi:oxygen-independent coproporphyrinogen III oxidase
LAPLPAPLQGHPLTPGPLDGPGLYLHVPFCRVRCPYCDFATAPYTAHGAARFVAAVLREAEAARGALGAAEFTTVFWGGGTPSRLEPSDLRALADGLGARLAVAPGAEFTLEANPEDVDAERLAAWRAAGINRVSLGVQSWDEGELRRLGRAHGERGAAAAAAAVGQAFDDWSLDLIFGFPGHAAAGWRRTLERALALGPPHLSAYHFTAEERTPMGDAVRAGRVVAPDDEGAAALFELAAEVLTGAGYRQYEVSNFARAGHESAHNLLYWRRRPYLGLGPSAVSFWGERRWRNVRQADQYAARLLGGRDCVEEVEDTAGRAPLETFMLGLRLAEGVGWKQIEALGAAAAAWTAAARRLAAEGVLEVDEAGVRVPPARRRLTDEVVLRLWREAEPPAPR